MVTLPTEAATDVAFAQTIVEHGVECVRINCAHDSPDVWAGMIDRIRCAERHAGSPHRTRVLMDIGGPRVRTVRPDSEAVVLDRYFIGDTLLLVKDVYRPPVRDLPLISCTLPEAIVCAPSSV